MIALIIVAIFILGPLAEIAVLIEAGRAFGLLPVVAACIGTAVLGAAILRVQGLAALGRAAGDLKDGRVPVEAAVDGIFLAMAAPMLLLPGFLTDAMGFLLLIPPLRHAIARQALARLRAKIAKGEARIEIFRP